MVDHHCPGLICSFLNMMGLDTVLKHAHIKWGNGHHSRLNELIWKMFGAIRGTYLSIGVLWKYMTMVTWDSSPFLPFLGSRMWNDMVVFLYKPWFWVNLITTSLFSLTGILVDKGNHPQMAELFRLVNYYNIIYPDDCVLYMFLLFPFIELNIPWIPICDRLKPTWNPKNINKEHNSAANPIINHPQCYPIYIKIQTILNTSLIYWVYPMIPIFLGVHLPLRIQENQYDGDLMSDPAAFYAGTTCAGEVN